MIGVGPKIKSVVAAPTLHGHEHRCQKLRRATVWGESLLDFTVNLTGGNVHFVPPTALRSTSTTHATGFSESVKHKSNV